MTPNQTQLHVEAGYKCAREMSLFGCCHLYKHNHTLPTPFRHGPKIAPCQAKRTIPVPESFFKCSITHSMIVSMQSGSCMCDTFVKESAEWEWRTKKRTQKWQKVPETGVACHDLGNHPISDQLDSQWHNYIPKKEHQVTERHTWPLSRRGKVTYTNTAAAAMV